MPAARARARALVRPLGLRAPPVALALPAVLVLLVALALPVVRVLPVARALAVQVQNRVVLLQPECHITLWPLPWRVRLLS